MGSVLGGLNPKPVWDYFEEICKYPRPSKKEEKIAGYILSWARSKNFKVKKDSLGNFVIQKPATPGMENRKPVVIQGHLDMVCEKNRDVEFDFDKDSIQPWIDGDWVKAKGTTLGADNGIGIAMGMAVLDSTDIEHPPIELLCTLDEETGLTGAMQLATDLLDAEILINLDSEEDGTFFIGCAGGQNTRGTYRFKYEQAASGMLFYEIALKGLKGGHSGLQINEGRGNAIKLLTRLLYNASKKFGIRLSSFNSGNKHNAIPREGFAIICVDKNKMSDFEKFVEEFNAIVKSEYQTKEPNISITFERVDNRSVVLPLDIQWKILNSFYAMPHGVIRMSPDIPGLVQTSTNFAIVETKDDSITALTSQRSSVESEKKYIADTVGCVFELGNAEVNMGDGYPAWQPNINSSVVQLARNVYRDIFGKEAKIEAIHAGLECGLIGEKYPGMDMISFGPTLHDVHSPDERISISTTENCWKLLLGILKNIPGK